MSNVYEASRDDIQPMLDDLGVLVEFGDVQAKGILKTVDQESAVTTGAGSLAARLVQVTVKTGTFPGLKEGVTITADSKTYTVIRALLISNGMLTRIDCQRS